MESAPTVPATSSLAARALAVATGGVLGALARYGHGALVDAAASGPFPWGTFTINLLGTFALASFLGFVGEVEEAHELWRPFFAVGVCGAYTTFSSFELETWQLLASGKGGVAFAYVLASVLLGLLCALLGLRALKRGEGLPPSWPRPLVRRAPPLAALSVLLVALAPLAFLALRSLRGEAASSLWLGAAAVAVGGSAGALARYGVGIAAVKLARSFFPWGTLFINITGSLLIGVYAGVAARTSVDPVVRLLLVTGWLGGYTTFSTFSFETAALLQEEKPGRAAWNVLASVLGGLGATAAGVALGERAA